MAERLRFGRDTNPPAIRRRVSGMAVLFVVCGALLAARWAMTSSPPVSESVVVEVRGDVPRPGFYERATVHDALRAAGASTDGQVDATLEPGTRLVVDGGRLRLEQMDALMVFGLPIDVNTAGVDALDSIPGVSSRLARAIVDDRDQNGAFDTIDDLSRVAGVGPATVEKLRPFLNASAPAEPVRGAK
ncbi:MAG: helix-hairpin-helix domain-containing protein [Myxococcota bacterium]